MSDSVSPRTEGDPVPLTERAGPLRFAYADAPYFGMCDRYEHDHGDDGRCWDDLDTHRRLVERMCDEFDGWAMSLHVPSLGDLLSVCPEDARVASWCKSFASFKPGVNPGYCWEPVIFWHPRSKRDRAERTVRDFFVCPITLERGFFGAKPEAFVWWVLDLLGVRRGVDTFTDLFHGSGAVERAYAAWSAQPELFGATA